MPKIYMIMLHLSIYSETSLNLTPSIQESPLNRNIAFGPKSTYSYITNPFKLESSLNQTFCPVLRWSGLEGIYCLPMIYPVNYCLNLPDNNNTSEAISECSAT